MLLAVHKIPGVHTVHNYILTVHINMFLKYTRYLEYIHYIYIYPCSIPVTWSTYRTSIYIYPCSTPVTWSSYSTSIYIYPSSTPDTWSTYTWGANVITLCTQYKTSHAYSILTWNHARTNECSRTKMFSSTRIHPSHSSLVLSGLCTQPPDTVNYVFYWYSAVPILLIQYSI